MLDHVISFTDDQHLIVERTVSADEPYLDQHRMGATPILPAVIGLEMMREALSLTGGRSVVGDVKIEHPLKVRAGEKVEVRIIVDGDDILVAGTARRPDGVVLDPNRVYLRGRRVERQTLPRRKPPEYTGKPSPFPYPRQIDRTRGSRLMFHGPVFRCLEGVLPAEDPDEDGVRRGSAQLVVPPVEALVTGTQPESWVIPAALLDGCLQASGLLGRILFSLSALPIGFGRVDVAPDATLRTGEPITLEVQIRTHGDDELISDLLASTTDGPLIHVEGYRAKVMRGL